MADLDRFLKDRLPRYATERNEPVPYMTSELSAHLHFGQIGPLTIALAVQGSDAPEECKAAYLEELIVRRELSINFVARNPRYDQLEGCPAWGLKTLAKHASDARRKVNGVGVRHHHESAEAAMFHEINLARDPVDP